MRKSYIEDVAEFTRKKMGIQNNQTEFNFYQVLGDYGVKVGYDSRIKGYSRASRKDSQYEIKLKNSGSVEFSKFLLAYELGHLILHFKKGKKFKTTTKMAKYKKKRATIFAMSFLMPEQLFRDIATEAAIVSNKGKKTIDTLYVASVFGLDEEIVIQRAKSLKII